MILTLTMSMIMMMIIVIIIVSKSSVPKSYIADCSTLTMNGWIQRDTTEQIKASDHRQILRTIELNWHFLHACKKFIEQQEARV